MSIDIKNISKSFNGRAVLENLSLEIGTGELVALLGPSGSGKTTLLRIIAGLEHPDRGAVDLHGADITGRSARERDIGFVFQHYALFRHMTVYNYIGYQHQQQRRQHHQSTQTRCKPRVGYCPPFVGPPNPPCGTCRHSYRNEPIHQLHKKWQANQNF